jgi:hypothetical protein
MCFGALYCVVLLAPLVSWRLSGEHSVRWWDQALLCVGGMEDADVGPGGAAEVSYPENGDMR